MSAYTKVYKAHWRAANREHWNAYQHDWYLANRDYWSTRYQEQKHPCEQCGELCGKAYALCFTCAMAARKTENERKKREREYQRTYYLSRKHKCADCDNLCAPKHERCVQCENRRRHAVHAYPET